MSISRTTNYNVRRMEHCSRLSPAVISIVAVCICALPACSSDSKLAAKNDNGTQNVGAAFSANQRVGTWMLNVAKSTLSPGRAPKSALQTAEMVGDFIKVTNDVTTDEGRNLKYGYTAKYDGKDYPF